MEELKLFITMVVSFITTLGALYYLFKGLAFSMAGKEETLSPSQKEFSPALKGDLKKREEQEHNYGIALGLTRFAFITSGILYLVFLQSPPVNYLAGASLLLFFGATIVMERRVLMPRFEMAKLLLADEEYKEASKIFEEVAHRIGCGKAMREQCYYQIAHCLDQLEKIPESLWAYRTYLQKYPRGKWHREAELAMNRIPEKERQRKERGKDSGETESISAPTLSRDEVVAQLSKKIGQVDPNLRREGTSQFSTGSRVGDYALVEEINRGGFGEVWKAHRVDRVDDSDEVEVVAVKIPTDPAYIENLKKFDSLQGAINSPYVVQPIEVEVTGRPPFLAMEYIEGTDLATLLKSEEKLSVEETIHLFQQIAWGLQAAHRRGIIHRDLKPDNVLLDKQSRVKITDFELGQVNVLTTSLSLSQNGDDGKVQGSLLYMAPEQMQGEEVDERADIYSLGVILFEMITGKLPQPGDRLEDFVDDTPDGLVEIFRQCYTRREKRASSVGELLEKLDELALVS